jgi:hypothetical protein
MFTDSFWTAENEFAWEALEGSPSPVARRQATATTPDNAPKYGPRSGIPALLQKREALAAEIMTAKGRKLADRINEMDRVNQQLRDRGYFPNGS